MNDPGLHEPIADDAKDVENQVKDEHEEEEEHELAFLEPRLVSSYSLGQRCRRSALKKSL
jgi:hypothetical protein